jgi:basic amino acid/polyamine antiporter, APA family
LGVLFCGYLMINLSSVTWIGFSIWTTAGLIVYIIYGYRHSHLNKK